MHFSRDWKSSPQQHEQFDHGQVEVDRCPLDAPSLKILPLFLAKRLLKLRIGGLRQKKAPTGAGAALAAGCVDVLRLVWYSRVKSGDHLDETDHRTIDPCDLGGIAK